MRTAITPSHRTPDQLIRRRMNTLLTPTHPAARPVARPHPTPPPTPPPDPAPAWPDPASLEPDPVELGPPAAPPPPAVPQPPAAPQAAVDPGPPGPRAGGALEQPVPERSPWRGLLARLPLAIQERLDLDRRALAGLSVLLVLALGYGVQHFWAGRPEPVAVPVADGAVLSGAASLDPATAEPPAPSRSSAPAPAGPAPGPSAGPAPGPSAASGVVVDVAGKVRAPGLRTLPQGARVQDALQAAGGPLPGTDLTGLNLARPLGDGEEVVVGVAGAGGASPGSGGGSPAAPLSLNSATAQQLDALPGVGPVLAQRVIRYREQHGGFQSVDQLRHVSGFGERRLQDLKAVLRP